MLHTITLEKSRRMSTNLAFLDTCILEPQFGYKMEYPTKQFAFPITCTFFLNFSKDEIRNDSAIKNAIAEQTKQWTEMIAKHKKEEWDLLRQHVQDSQEAMKALMLTVQATQIKQLEERHAR